MTDNTRGALLMIASMLAFTVNDAWRAVDFSDHGSVVVTGPLAIACAPDGSQVDCSALLVRNRRHNVFSHCAV